MTYVPLEKNRKASTKKGEVVVHNDGQFPVHDAYRIDEDGAIVSEHISIKGQRGKERI